MREGTAKQSNHISLSLGLNWRLFGLASRGWLVTCATVCTCFTPVGCLAYSSGLKMEAVRFAETSINETTLCHVPDEHTLHYFLGRTMYVFLNLSCRHTHPVALFHGIWFQVQYCRGFAVVWLILQFLWIDFSRLIGRNFHGGHARGWSTIFVRGQRLAPSNSLTEQFQYFVASRQSSWKMCF